MSKQQASVDVLEQIRMVADFMKISVANWYSKEGEILFIALADEEGNVDWQDSLESYSPHTNWNQLMPVVEKISKMPLLNADNTICTDPVDTCFPVTFNMPTEDGKVMFRFKGFSLHTADTLIDAAWQAVVEVLEYEFNNTQTNNQ